MNTNDSPNSAQAASPTPEPVPYRDRWRRNDDQRLSAGLLEGEAGQESPPIAVTEADREAAAQIYQAFRDHDFAQWIRKGENAGGDFNFVIQAFARHRLTPQADIGKDAGEREVLLANLERLKSWCRAQDPNATIWLHIDQAIAALSPSPVKDVLEAAEWTKDAARELHAGMIQAARDCAGSHGAPQSAVREAGSMFLYAAIRNLAGQSREKA